jgi:hypothetical protein
MTAAPPNSWSCVRNHGPHHGTYTCVAHMQHETWAGGRFIASIDTWFYDTLPRQFQAEYNVRAFLAAVKANSVNRDRQFGIPGRNPQAGIPGPNSG